MSQAQIEMFVPRAAAVGDDWKVHRAANAGEVRYRCPNPKLIVFEGINGETGQATWHPSQGGKWFTQVGGQKIHIRDKSGNKKKELLTRIALAKSDAEKAREIQRLAQELEVSALRRTQHDQSEARPRKRNTLCMEPEPMDYEPRRIVPTTLFASIPSDDFDSPTFAALPLWLFQREELTHGEKIVYARLATYAGKRGCSTCSEVGLAKEIGMSRPQVRKILCSLFNRNLIMEVETGKWGKSHYGFLWHPWIAEWEKKHRDSCKLSLQVPDNLVSDSCKLSSHEKRKEKRFGKDVSPDATIRGEEGADSAGDEESNCSEDDKTESPMPSAWSKRR